MRPLRWIKKWLILTACFLLVFFVLVVLLWRLFPPQVLISHPFSAQPIAVNTYDWYDLGTVDFNQDGNLDVFTTSHWKRQSFLVSDRQGGFDDNLSKYGLHQDAFFPGLEDSGKAPSFSGPGLYIYFQNENLCFETVTGTNVQPFSGSLLVPMGAEILRQKNFSAKHFSAGTNDFPESNVRFDSTGNGFLKLATRVSVPIRVQLEPTLPLEKIFIGAECRHPVSHDFELYLKDRHGIAWSDYNDDGMLDAFIVRGGLGGQMHRVSRELNDQFYVSTSAQSYRDVISEKGFRKNNNPARQVAWVDVNGDSRLDLYIPGGRKVVGFWEYIPSRIRNRIKTKGKFRNMLYLQTADGNFHDAAEKYGLDFDVSGIFLWFDPDNDSDADLLWASEYQVALYRNNGAGFDPEILIPGSTTVQPRKLAAADFDEDGDMDVFVGSAIGSQLLINDSGKLHAADPEAYGLPTHIRTVHWVDYDNDGLMDLYAWPGGIYQQTADGHFDETGLLKMPSFFWPFIDVRSLWFDYDNDGDRDVIIMQRFFPRIIQKTFPEIFPYTAQFLENELPSENNWFQLTLCGKKGNREAIGAAVTVSTPNGRHRQFVGQFESSHFSQGHYRLYFGLKDAPAPDTVTVQWPDGHIEDIRKPLNRQHVYVKRGQ